MVVGLGVIVGVLVGGQLPLHGVFVGVAVNTAVGVEVTDGVAVAVGVPVGVGVVLSRLQSCTMPTGAQRAASTEPGCFGVNNSPAAAAASDKRSAPSKMKLIRDLGIIPAPSRLVSRSYARREQPSRRVY